MYLDCIQIINPVNPDYYLLQKILIEIFVLKNVVYTRVKKG